MSHQERELSGQVEAKVAKRYHWRGSFSLPNLITIARIATVPVLLWMLASGMPQPAFYLFVVAGLSDAVDGYLAKRFNQRTELGAYLDPLADKLLVAGVFVTLGLIGELPIWLVWAVVARDVLILAAIALSALLLRPLRIKPFYVSKVNTALQILLAAVVLANGAFDLQWHFVRDVLIWTTLAFTLLSLVAYAGHWIGHLMDAGAVG